MERVMTVEEKIRRAEEIYQKRRQGETRPIAKVTVNEKKDIRLLRKMIIQMLICVAIYLIIYAVQNNQYVFSNDFINKANEILSYDTNFLELYEMVKNQVLAWSNQEKEQDQEPKQEEGQEGQEQNQDQNQEGQNQEVLNEAIGGATETLEEEAPQTLSQEQQEIQDIKNTTTFIKPLEGGVISSPFGVREGATGTVPKNHTGTDIAANQGTKIKAATEGEVVLASSEGDYGNHLKIQIGEVSIIYAHCHQLYVKQGDKITQGQEIAEVGSTRKFDRTTFAL